MKKITLVFCTLMFGLGAFCQSSGFGLKGGLNVSHLNNSNGTEMGSKLGFHAGVLAHVHLSPQIAIQPEVVYSSQGTKYTVADGEHELGLGYINIPVQLQYMFNNGFRLQTGPQLGFLASVKDKTRGAETGIFTSDDFKAIDFSWSVGLGYLSTSGLGIDGRYNFGMSDINDFGTNSLKNSVFQVGLFYMLPSNR
jgi:hypothetical protein